MNHGIKGMCLRLFFIVFCYLYDFVEQFKVLEMGILLFCSPLEFCFWLFHLCSFAHVIFYVTCICVIFYFINFVIQIFSIYLFICCFLMATKYVISGKAWGKPSIENRILMAHGVMHNCGSFNRLIQHLKGDYFIVAIDLPGHGRSSHFPSGFPLRMLDYVLAVKRVVDHLQWQYGFVYIGHSFGGQIGTYLSAIFPSHVIKLIIIDTMEPRPVLLNETLTYVQSQFQKLLEIEHKLMKNDPPVYTRTEAFEKVQKNNNWPLCNEAVNDLMERAVKPCKNGVTFVADQRLKCPMRPSLTFEQQTKFIENISCPTLFILAEDNMARYDTYLKSMYEYNQKQINCTILTVPGDHAIHQNDPKKVGELINEFLKV